MKYFLSIIFLSLFLPQSVSAATMLDVPFTAQSPYFDWIQPWEDACEESVISMVDVFYRQKAYADQADAAAHISHIFAIKEQYYGVSLDEDTRTMTDLINNFLSWEAYIVEQPSIDLIKEQVRAGHPVIVPTAGKELYNPYFFDGGPPYHTIIISGFDDATQEFITQEPGTRRGQDYRYSYATIMNAMHDFTTRSTMQAGVPRAIFTSPTLRKSATLDADQDGLDKVTELSLGTKTYSLDSDNDLYPDGVEVGAGYSPLVNETLLFDGALVKTTSDPRVYYIDTGNKRHILSESVFLMNGWRWENIVTVSDRFLSHLPTISSVDRKLSP